MPTQRPAPSRRATPRDRRQRASRDPREPAAANAPARAAGTATPKGTRVRVRMYRHGLGDCFLLTLRQGARPDFHVAIDCGVLTGSPNGPARLEQAVRDIHAETGGRLDLLVATHEHADHLSGFNRSRTVWEDFTIQATWLAWTENREDPAVKALKDGQRLRLRAALAGVERLEASLAGLSGVDAAHATGRVAGIRGLLAFALDDDDQPSNVLHPGAGDAPLTGPARALEWLKERAGDSLEYCHPKHAPRALPGLDGIRVFVLGPPAGPLIRHSDPSPGEAYELLFGCVPSGDACFGMAAAGGSEFCGPGVTPETAQPFDAFYQRPIGDVRSGRADPKGFFAQHYGFGDQDLEAWRRIETDWLNVSESLALALTGHINNTSLVLAFELGEEGPVLLFPGDAQAGSWLSWADLTWEVPTAGGGRRTVKGADLLRRTSFYKVGHHGSHNATMKDRGLELMERRDLVAFIPVHQATAHRQKPVWNMPWPPLWNALKQKARHRVILSDMDEPMAAQSESPAAAANDASLQRAWKAFQKGLRWDTSPNQLWVEYTFRAR